MFGAVSSAALVPLIVIATVVAIDSWVYADAKRRADAGRPVTFQAGGLAVDTPPMWFAGCLVLFIIFFPLYLTRRY